MIMRTSSIKQSVPEQMHVNTTITNQIIFSFLGGGPHVKDLIVIVL